MYSALTIKYTQRLNELNKDTLPEAGGKAANLGELIQAGLPVPLGFVVTTSAYRSHLEESRLQERIANRLMGLTENDFTGLAEASDDIVSWIEAAPMPIQVQGEVSKAFESLSEKMGSDGKLLVAVRSSATAEDLASASFAGQHDTYLGIHGKESVLKHVKKCWASLWTSQAISYRISMGFEHLKVELAVVVQAMIASEVSGVMFTANPVNGNEDEILISAGYGLGEAIVSGLITPDTYIITKTGIVKEKFVGSKEICISLKENGTMTEDISQSKRKSFCLGTDELLQLMNLANAVEKHYGTSMDTEWALFGGKIYMLQARPITTMTSGDEVLKILSSEDKIIYQGKKAPFGLQSAMEHCSEPMTPLDFAAFCQSYQSFYSFLHDYAGLRPPKEQIKPIERESGVVAIKFNDPRLSPAMIWKIPTSIIKDFSKTAEDIWHPIAEEMDAFMERINAAAEDIDDAEKAATLVEQAINEQGMLFCKRMTDFIPSAVSYFKFNGLVKKAVGKENAEALKESLQKALPFRTALQNKSMITVAQAAAIHGKNSNVFKAELNNFLKEYGDRPSVGMAATLGSPTWREKPEIIHELIDALLCDTNLLNSEESFKKQEAEYEAAKERVAKGLSQGKYRKFLKVLEETRNAVIVREEGLFYLEKLTACIRRLILKLGRLLVSKSLINETEDVFFIFMEELALVVQGKLGIKEKIEKRKKAFKKVYAAHEKGVHWMISTGSFPVFEKKKTRKEDERALSDSLKGVSASRGVYEGPVCIVMGPSEFNKLRKGDILVSSYTAPVWTPLFRVASAVVTEIGSAGSHAAIVSREYGLPCVVDIHNITNILKDGQKIRVDGTNGIVTLLSE